MSPGLSRESRGFCRICLSALHLPIRPRLPLLMAESSMTESASELMPEEFNIYGTLVQTSLDGLRPVDDEADVCFSLVRSLQTFAAWRDGVNRSIHLSPSALLPTFKTTFAKDIFPFVTASVLTIRARWMHEGFPSSLTPLTTPLDDDKEKRNIQYWLGKIPDRLIDLRDRFNNLLHITSPKLSLDGGPITSQALQQHAVNLGKTSEQLRLISNIFYCAAGVREMVEMGPREYFVSVSFHFFSLMFI
jgi:hypothetical protein